ncbi:hypothetical protein RHVP.34 [Cricetid gammaherpesvirus 2]|uniref:Protein UL95 n=1 Tax=Cricetid gammaherpesvirus 2 TaxID=1605972 RepID=E9M5L8_9GAMA|nr:hypothetical protein RHVP.34 [Cricetid gammaherpesvirus 2]ADW24376.1 hypothetical protein RHVP.34 [Cricetid gammaherpesvirus 2]ADW24458.1 hypothetical protein RHVP-L.34 [Cricetid gammaherpesvirus 2]
MTDLNNLICSRDPALERTFKKCISLALQMGNNLPGQFRVIETPINSFLLVGDALPKEVLSYMKTNTCDSLDFSTLSLPRVTKLTEPEDTATNPEIKQYQLKEEPPYKCIQASPENGLIYHLQAWTAAMGYQLDQLIKKVIELTAIPENWTAVLPVDPVACMWLLFCGPKSFCEEMCCMSEILLGVRGPILLPPHMYHPEISISSFLNFLCQYVKHLYKDFTERIESPGIDRRATECLARIQTLEETDVFLTRCCLFCHLYRQNHMVSQGTCGSATCIILAPPGHTFLAQTIRVAVTEHKKDCTLLPTYDLTLLANYFKDTYGAQNCIKEVDWDSI